jgi:hypothetical protein
MRYLITATILLLFTTGLEAKELNLSEVMRATCRVSADRINQFGEIIGSSRGTGTVISEDNSYYYVMTNGHVASNTGSTVHLEFFNEGYKSEKIPARVYWRYYETDTSKDAALIKLEKSNLNGYVPVVIPMAPEGHTTPIGTKIYGAGYPKGMWLSAWIARVAYMADNRMFFDMTPQGGQSGTAILSKVTIDGEDYTRVSGMLSWHYKDGGSTYGGAINLDRLYELFATNAAADDFIQAGELREIACDFCKHDIKDHYVVKYKNGSTYKKNNQIQYFCPVDVSTLKSNVELGLYGKDAKLVKTGVDFPVFPKDPKIEDIDPNNDKPLFPIAPPPPVDDDEKDELKKRIGVLERLKNSIENKLKDAVEEKKKESEKYKSLKGLHDKLIDDKSKVDSKLSQKILDLDLVDGLYRKEYDKNGILKEDNRSLVGKVQDWEDRHNALLLRLEKLAEDKEDWLNNITLPYINVGLGTFLVWLLGLLASGTLGATLMSKYIQPFMIRRFGFFPTKIAGAIFRRKYPVASKPLFKTIPKGSEQHMFGEDVEVGVVDSNEVFDIKPPDKE